MDAMARRARLRLYRSIDDARQTWRRFEADADLYGVQTFAWNSHWQATVGKAVGVTPCLVHVADAEGRPLLWLPLAIRRRGVTRILTWMGGEITDYQAPILGKDYTERTRPGDFARLWARIETSLPPHDVVHFERQPARVGDQPNPVLELSSQKVHETNHFCHVDADWEAFGPKLIGSRACADLRRKRRRLEELGSLKFTVARDPGTMRAITAKMIDQKIERYVHTRTYNLFKTGAYRAFFLEPSRELFDSGMLHVSALELDDRVLATHWGIVFDGRLYYIMASFEAGDLVNYSAGRQLLEHLFRWCAASEIPLLDFTVGDEPWKKKWSNRRQDLYERIVPRSARGFAYATFVRGANAIRRRPAIHRLVSGIRNLRG